MIAYARAAEHHAKGLRVSEIATALGLFGDSTMVGSRIVSISDVVFPEPGMCHIQLLGDSELLMERGILGAQSQVTKTAD